MTEETYENLLKALEYLQVPTLDLPLDEWLKRPVSARDLEIIQRFHEREEMERMGTIGAEFTMEDIKRVLGD